MANWSKNPEHNFRCGRGRMRRLADSGVWHFFFRDLNGKWRDKSTRHTDRGGAVKWAEAFSMCLTREEFTGVDLPPIYVPTAMRV